MLSQYSRELSREPRGPLDTYQKLLCQQQFAQVPVILCQWGSATTGEWPWLCSNANRNKTSKSKFSSLKWWDRALRIHTQGIDLLHKKELFLDSQLFWKTNLHNPEFAPKHIQTSTTVLANLKFDWLQIKSLRKACTLPATCFCLRRCKSPNCTCCISVPFLFQKIFLISNLRRYNKNAHSELYYLVNL